MFKLTAKVLSAFMLASVVAGLLSSCGNKGDLFLVPDQMTEQELLRLEQTLGGSDDTMPIDPDSISEPASEPGDDPDDSGKPSRKPSTSRN